VSPVREEVTEFQTDERLDELQRSKQLALAARNWPVHRARAESWRWRSVGRDGYASEAVSFKWQALLDNPPCLFA